MKKLFIISTLILFFVSCKSEKKDTKDDVKQDEQTVEVKNRKNSFESKLIDAREVNKEIISGLKVKGFGIQKINDSVVGFVFKLDESTDAETVSKYSYGLRGYYEESSKPFRTSASPDMKIIDENKYIIIRRKVMDIDYFDSLDVYIYKRKDWKGSGRLGGMKIHDILFE